MMEHGPLFLRKVRLGGCNSHLDAVHPGRSRDPVVPFGRGRLHFDYGIWPTNAIKGQVRAWMCAQSKNWRYE